MNHRMQLSLAALFASCIRSITLAQETDNINGPHTVFAGDNYADNAGFFGNNWGINGQSKWYVKVTFSQSAATYTANSQYTCFANTVEYYDWNKLWGKARCGYTHSHQQDSDRFVWRRLQNLHSAPNCAGMANCYGIQLGTYSYDAGATPYPNENWALSKTFSTVLQPGVTYVLGMESFANGEVLHSLYSNDWTLLESKTNVHSNLCANYEQGSVLGLYFGGTCVAPEDITVVYEAVEGPPGPTSNPTNAPTTSPTFSGYCSDGSNRCNLNGGDVSTCECAAVNGRNLHQSVHGSSSSQLRRILPGKPPKTPPPATAEPTSSPNKVPTIEPTTSPTGPLPCECRANAPLTTSPTTHPSNNPTSPPVPPQCGGSGEPCCSGPNKCNNNLSCSGSGPNKSCK